jgi:hypothetical protein
MRTLEMLLLVADLAAFGILAVPRFSNARWWRLSAIVGMVFGFAQVVVEGPRWQMVPAYVLTLLFFVVSIAQRVGVADDAARRGWRTHVAIGLGVAGLAVAVALPRMVPLFRFPPPTGPYAIGTLTYHWTDVARLEAFAADSASPRELIVQIWYPAQAKSSGTRAAYLPDAAAVTAAFARIQNKPAFIFGHLQYVTTHAMPAAHAASDLSSFPVLLFLEGATGFRQMNTYQVEHLASHGYIVVAIDQPGAAAAVVFPDGHQILGLDLAQFQATVGPSYLPHKPAPPNGVNIPPGLERLGGRIIPYLAGDVGFTLDQLAALNRADPSGILTGKLDLQRVGAFGISLGGIVVGEACRREARIRACLVMDAPMSADVVHSGLRQPVMWVTRDAASMRLERQRAGGWSEEEIEAHQTSMRAVYEGLSGAGYFVRVPGMFHSNFTDVARWTPLAEGLGLAGPIDPQRAHDIVNAYSLAFFDRHVNGRPAKLLDGPAKQYPDVVFESRAP